MDAWHVLAQTLILLTAALVLGTIAERLRQNAIIGYLLAGTIVGPNVLRLVPTEQSVTTVAELGAALLLFTIGLEFSFRSLRRMGRAIFAGGILQITTTTLACYLMLILAGISHGTALALGIMLSMSSTAVVLRVLADSATLETPYGRNSMGILLLQDAAILPLTLVVGTLAEGAAPATLMLHLLRSILIMLVMLAGFYLVINRVAPRLLNLRQWASNREFPIILATVLAIGSAFIAHGLGISSAIGAFIAGLMLAESPFAVQIRADVAPLKTILVTIFFGSIGMLSNPMWVASHWEIVTLGTLGALVLKSTLVWFVLRMLGLPQGISLASGLCLANVGEFSFVLAGLATDPDPAKSLITQDQFAAVVSVTVITLILSPYLVKLAPLSAGLLERLISRHTHRPIPEIPQELFAETPASTILLIGFGPAGQWVAQELMTHHAKEIAVIELNPKGASIADRYGLKCFIGDACQTEILEKAGISRSQIIVITLPDPGTSQQVINLCRSLSPHARLLVRARYHAYRWELQMAGADVVVDEEEEIGHALAARVRQAVSSQG